MIVRPATDADIAPMLAILNAIIAKGGTTAIEEPLDAGTFRRWFLDGPQSLSCLVAEQDGTILGFQSLARHSKLPPDWGDIATFAAAPKSGAGSALFAETLKAAAALNLAVINATVRADNAGGLAFYERMGFRTWRTDGAVPLKDGTPVDRISKRRAVPGGDV